MPDISSHARTYILLGCSMLIASFYLPSAWGCVQAAESAFRLPKGILSAIADTESGLVGIGLQNKNGTSDMGLFQINSVHIPTLEKRLQRDPRIIAHTLRHDPCFGAIVAGWLLAKHIEKAKERDLPITWAYGAYHSQTPHLNARYAHKVTQKLMQQ